MGDYDINLLSCSKYVETTSSIDIVYAQSSMALFGRKPGNNHDR